MTLPTTAALLLAGLLALVGCDQNTTAEAQSVAAEVPEASEDSADFAMKVMDAFAISSQGSELKTNALTGIVTQGTVRRGDQVCVQLTSGAREKRTVQAIQIRQDAVEEATEGQMPALMIDDIDVKQVAKNELLTTDC